MNNQIINNDLNLLSNKIRYKLVEISNVSKTAHLGSALSCVDILVALYWGILDINPENPNIPERDRFILSKGHAAMAIFSVLAMRGFFPIDNLKDFAKVGCPLEEHPAPGSAPGIEMATGSLGHGLSVALGMALAAKINKQKYSTYVLLGDGECNEGEIWEAAMFAAANCLDNLTIIVDFNKWQATGRSCEVMLQNNLKEKWQAFGWNSYDIDGHNIEDLINTLSFTNNNGKPKAIIAHTIKGKGISFMEDDNNWHYRIPTDEEVILSKKELGIV